ncbi:MAG: hypothetical protein V2I97_24455 [Desulfococcaceae bacterium]|nr:hypothetical protein [Desulfococcaceae bacterium]
MNKHIIYGIFFCCGYLIPVRKNIGLPELPKPSLPGHSDHINNHLTTCPMTDYPKPCPRPPFETTNPFIRKINPFYTVCRFHPI